MPFTVQQLLLSLQDHVPPDVNATFLEFGVVVAGPARSGKSSVAFQSAINAVLRGHHALILAHPATAQARRPMRPVTAVDTLPTDALERLDFAYTATAKACCQALASIGTSLDGGAVPHTIVVDYDTMEDREDPLPLAKLLALLANTVAFTRQALSHCSADFSPHFVIVVDVLCLSGGVVTSIRDSSSLLTTFPLSSVPLSLIDVVPTTRGVEIFLVSRSLPRRMLCLVDFFASPVAVSYP